MIDAHVRRDLISQWAFDSRPVLGRFHLWLEDVEEHRIAGEPAQDLSFVGTSLERCLIMTAGVTALGTRLFGRWGEGKGLDAQQTNHVKKDADAVSAYAMSEGLWYLTRSLPENHAIMVCLGEGLMPKGGETPDMGSNPLLGFGRVYARPSVAKWLDQRVHRFINDPGYGWKAFWTELVASRITVWGAAIDTLENTSRFAKGAPTGPTTVLHLFDQPLRIARPYEGYTGAMTLPKRVFEAAADASVLLDFLAPRELVMQAIRRAYPGIEPQDVHVWTLGGPTRVPRISKLWDEWKGIGAHLVEEGWLLPSGLGAFTDSGTYAPTYRVGPFTGADGRLQLFITDGYAASAEALQAASLDPVLGNQTSMCLFTSKFEISYEKERHLLHLDPAAPTSRSGSPRRWARGHGEGLPRIRVHPEQRARGGDAHRQEDDHRGRLLPEEGVARPLAHGEHAPRAVHRAPGRGGDPAGRLPRHDPRVLGRRDPRRDPHAPPDGVLRPDRPRLLAAARPLLPRPGLEEARRQGLRLGPHPQRAPDALLRGARVLRRQRGIRIHFDKIDDAVLAPDKKALIREVLTWYCEHHPTWFGWLEMV